MSENHHDDDKTQTHIPLLKDTTVGHYRIIEKIGAGGMGEVYLAEDTRLDRKVALKFLPHHLCQDENCRARFKREAQATAKLDHTNIVTVHEVSEYSGRPFIVMQYVGETSLRDVIAARKLELNEVIDLAASIAKGLAAAHQAEITHRDIKPANILVDDSGQPKLVDFGLAQVAGTTRLTETGSTMGTLEYMSPEQVEGRPTDARSDLFSLGVVLYEMITGKRPFTGQYAQAIIYSTINEDPEPLSRYKSGVPEGLQRIVSKLLSKDPSLRYQHADDLIADLRRLLSSPVGPVKSRIGVWSGIAAVSLMMIVAVLWRPWIGTRSDGGSDKIMLAVLPFENIGSEEDEAFADGITDAITSRLARISGLGVISRTSSIQYKNTDKTLPEIGQELGVNYVLEGTILWDKSGDTERVRITPQLIEVENDVHVWADEYERTLERIFAMHADIATSIARELNITLLENERDFLQEKPTENMEAYQAYLAARRNRFYSSHRGKYDTALAVRMYRQAIDLDPGFALAYADLSFEHTLQYSVAFDHTEERLQRAKEAVDSALALEPDLPEAHLALGYYYLEGHSDHEKAFEEIAIAERGLPNDPRVPRAKGSIFRSQGNWIRALENYERAFRWDPRNISSAMTLILAHSALRNYQEALRYADRVISIQPDFAWVYQYKFNTYCAQGNVSGARSALQDGHFKFWLIWMQLHELERDYQAALDSVGPRRGQHFAHDLGFWTGDGMAGLLYRYMGDTIRAGEAFESSRAFLESHREQYGDYFGFHSTLGIAYAGLGRKEEAIREGKLSIEQFPTSRDASVGPVLIGELARIYVMVEEYDAALALLDSLLSFPNLAMSVGHLRTHPHWDPLRDHPRFQALLEKYATTN